MRNPEERLPALMLTVIGIVLVSAMYADHFILGVLLLAVTGIMFLIAGSPVRLLSVIYSLQLVLTIGELRAISFISVRIDEMLLLLVIWLWILSLPDGSMKGLRIGKQGYFITAFLLLYLVAAYRGFVGGSSPESLREQFRTYGGYFMYFPLLWVLSDRKSASLLWKMLLASGVLGALIHTYKGYRGLGEDVYVREETGMRVATRQPNAYAAIMLMYVGRLWKNWKNRPAIIFVVPPIVIFCISILLSQTRGIWGGVLLAFGAAWILNLFRRRDRVRLSRKILVSITALTVIVMISVLGVSVLGIISTSDIARRAGSQPTEDAVDVSALSRIVAWGAIAETLKGPALLTGRGSGAEYTCFRPDIGAVVTRYYVDSSYFQVALNMGLIGVCCMLGIFVTTLVRSAFLFLRTDSKYRAGVALGLFSASIMLLFAAGFASVLTGYRFTASLWVFIPALLQIEIRREENEKSREFIE